MTPSVSPRTYAIGSGSPLGRKRKLSEGDDFSDTDSVSSPKSASPCIDDDRRQHHNELERRRRDHIKGSFTALGHAIRLANGTKDDEKSSRAVILKSAAEKITSQHKKIAQMEEQLAEQAKIIKELSANQSIISIKQPEIPNAYGVATTSAPVNPLTSYSSLNYVPASSATVSLPSLSLNSRMSLDNLPTFKTHPNLLAPTVPDVTNSTIDHLLNQFVLLQQQQKLQQLPLVQPQPIKPTPQTFYDLQAQVFARGAMQA